MADTLRRLADLARRRANDGNAERVEQLLEKLQTQTFSLVVFGEFKRGKTTFINALLGEDLLPSAVVPLTSVVTILRFGLQRQVTVEFLDGHSETIPVEGLPEYVTERGNPENRRQVKVVYVNVPSPLLRGGLQLVDTPGVGSVYDHNTEATREFLPHVDGAILLVASDPPISRGECEFLREMRPHVARLFVVQNKIDQLRPPEVEESLAFTEGVLCDVLGRDGVQVYALSAREALEAQLAGDARRLEESGLPVFLEELRRFQQQEQADTLLRSVETVGYLAAPSRFRWQDWRWETRPGLSGSFPGSLLPRARERTLRALETNLLSEHDNACRRLRYDFAERTQAAFDDYVRSVDRSLTETLTGIDRAIERAVAQKQRTLEEADETAERVGAQSAELEGLMAELMAMQPEAMVHG